MNQTSKQTSVSVVLPMSKSELARHYFPEAQAAVATNHLMRWIHGSPPLLEALKHTGYRRSQKIFTVLQIRLIFHFLGSPEN